MTERISNRQLIFILIMNRTIIGLSKLPEINTGTAAQDAWATSLVVGAGTALLAIVIAGLGVRFPDKTIIHYSQDLLG